MTVSPTRPGPGPVRRSRARAGLVRLATAGAAALAVIGVLAFGFRGGPAPAPEAGTPAGWPTASVQLPGAGTPAAGFNPTDVAWLQLMIPMNERMLRLLDLAPAQAADPAVRALAARIATGHRAELTELRAALRRSGTPEVDVHAGHDMPGMVPLAELAAARTTRGAAFDELVRTGLRAHLAQSVLVARGERTAGAEPGVKALAAGFETSRGAELARLPQG